jgi:hypothetical protein
MADVGFFERWGKRKAAARQGTALPEPAPLLPAATQTAHPQALAVEPATSGDQRAVDPQQPQETPPALTLVDASALTPASDFKPFMAQQVSPEVRNAAMKQLFADPHFNVMDGLDIYIDDYSKADPIPESMLRQMVSAKFLNLFPDEPAAAALPLTDQTLPPVKPDHDHTHLQLQPDDAASAEDSGKRVA